MPTTGKIPSTMATLTINSTISEPMPIANMELKLSRAVRAGLDGKKICAVGCRQKAGAPARMILRPALQRAQAGLISAPTSAFVGDRESIKLPPDPRERRVWTFIGFTSLVRTDN